AMVLPYTLPPFSIPTGGGIWAPPGHQARLHFAGGWGAVARGAERTAPLAGHSARPGKRGALPSSGNRLEGLEPLEEGRDLVMGERAACAVLELREQLLARHGVVATAADKMIDAARQPTAVLHRDDNLGAELFGALLRHVRVWSGGDEWEQAPNALFYHRVALEIADAHRA